MKTIRYCTPYSTEKNLAQAYNEEVANSNTDYICFMDRDIIPHSKFGHHISEIINTFPGLNYFTCLTNRINTRWQRYSDIWGNDIKEHMALAQRIWDLHGRAVEMHDHSPLWSGMLMVCPVKGWIPLETKGLLGIDNEIHSNALKQGRHILLMKGVYVYHYYSNFDDFSGFGSAHSKRDKSHLT